MKKITTFVALAAIVTLGFFSAGSALALDKIKVGTTSGPDVEILEKAREVAAQNGLTVEIVEFSDYVAPNLALAAKDIDLNSFQHLPYLENFNRERQLNLVSIGTTYISPIGFYSDKIKDLKEVKKGDRLAIPNDATNGGRALLLLQKAGLLTLREGAALEATPFDIEKNSLDLIIVELDAAQTPRSLKDVAAAAINNTYAIPAGLQPTRDAIYLEDMDSPYVNVIAARPEDRDNQLYKKFVAAYQSQEVADFILTRFSGATMPAFSGRK
ncbi:MAG: MetQ/NlpA family ABC transporter substrate-binding protein [Candidatus Adiutrix sp.]|jgi:D-methionine transport system substrate-binding protein|nr:MetQ/NlpA family ABC transporter substrate-binding protein [Candidatus Adiutrix sp.]